ncbi:DUF2071 domain-containing protein [Solilutibacter silvestris]|uniref:DUF2071 domain-containing protein n=1 Tax=Solilutibacter silvestris TaxID=1645665 RepID=A0A2K1Q3Z6_9GAMM|nr:DUF2071 domain-containing protein [Lysobacter silvestris]PNS09759.1 hypothetical protein Lysil_1388 [Lysobacter silvestris]
MQQPLKFSEFLHDRPAPSGIDVHCKLQHFAIITYAFDPSRFSGVMPDRFRLDTVHINGSEKALISVVPFVDVDFTSAVFPFPKFRMGQTNYRIYIVDTLTGERCVWFIGTTLDSWTRILPHRFWKLPWYPGHVRFECQQREDGSYAKYSMKTVATWGPASVELTSGGEILLPGFPDIETGLVFLTHPLRGYYHRLDGELGTYRVWHKQLEVAPAHLKHAEFGLLDRLGLVTLQEQQHPYSVLIEPINEFTIYLPPKVIRK